MRERLRARERIRERECERERMRKKMRARERECKRENEQARGCRLLYIVYTWEKSKANKMRVESRAMFHPFFSLWSHFPQKDMKLSSESQKLS